MTNSPKVRPTFLRRLLRLQFSIRFLLLLFVVVAIVCAWALQPQAEEQEFLNGAVKLRRYVRSVAVEGVEPPQRINHGRWEIRDFDDQLVVKGRYDNGQASGWWTAYYANGQKSIQGKCRGGVRVGVWRAWHENGQLKTKYRYGDERARRIVKSHRGDSRFAADSFAGEVFKNPDGESIFRSMYSSLREGPIRGWRDDGSLVYEGQYAHDQRTGVWTFYDSSGNVQEEGEYRNDVRHGWWETKIATSAAERVYLAHGRRFDDVGSRLAELAAQMKSGGAAERIEAIRALTVLGAAAAPLLGELLAHQDAEVRLLAARSLGEMGDEAIEQLPAIQAAARRDEDARVRLRARIALYLVDETQRASLAAPLRRELSESPHTRVRIGGLMDMAECDAARRNDLLAELLTIAADHDSPPGRLAAATIAARGREAFMWLDEALSSDDVQVRRGAGEVLLVIDRGDDDYRAMLLSRAAEDEDDLVRNKAESVRHLFGPSFCGSVRF